MILIVNGSLDTGVIPSRFKKAIFALLIKKISLDKEVLENYRTVSNLSSFSKVLERIVSRHLMCHIGSQNVIEIFQSAHRHSTQCRNCFGVRNDILRALDSKSIVLVVFLALSAAFDTVTISLLTVLLPQELRVQH